MSWGHWKLQTFLWGLAAAFGVLVVVTGLTFASLALDLTWETMVPFNLAAYFVAGSLVAGLARGGAQEGAQAGILVGLVDGTLGWLPPTLIFANRPDLHPAPLVGPNGLNWDLLLFSILLSVAFAVMLGMLGGWVISKLR